MIGIIIIHYGSLMLVGGGSRGREEVISKPLIERGPILDRNGRILSIQTRLFSVTAWIPSLTEPQQSAEQLGEILDISADELYNDFTQRKGFMYVKRKISPTESDKIRALKEKGELEGISLEPEYGRNYPEKTLASHVLGYVGTDNIGLSGIEYTFENELSPELSNTREKEVYGNQIFLTIDLNIQHFSENIARKAYQDHNAESVMLLVMGAKTGDLLGYVSIPNFDPNNFNQFSQDARKNRPISYSYEPGSVFKAFSLSSFLEIGGIDLTDDFYCRGYYEIDPPGNEPEKLKCLGVHGAVTPGEIIQYSCNAGAAYASETVEKNAFYQMLKQFGFGEPTGLPLPGESYGLLRKPNDWSYRSKPTIAIGQEISVTTVQIASAATVFANRGMLLKPHIVKKIVTPGGEVIRENERTPLRKVVSESVASNMLSMMESATAEAGTASRTAVEGLRVSAKTGTAQMLDRETGKYSEEAFIPSCLALFPTEDPQFIIYTVIVHPRAGEYYGGRIAAPVVKEVIEELVQYYGIATDEDTVVRHPGRITIEQTEPLQVKDTVPDLDGLSKRELLPLLQDKRINVVIEGEGWVVSQDPPAGTPIKKGMTITVELE
jgi:cell division protein FtsI (penicillin-binding protein 3)